MMSLPSLAMSSYSHHEALLPAAPATSSLQKVGKLMDSNDYFLTSIFSSSRDQALNNDNNNNHGAMETVCSGTDEPEKLAPLSLPSPGNSQTSTTSKVSFDTNASLGTTDDSFVLAYSESDPEDVDNVQHDEVSAGSNSVEKCQSMLTYIPSQADSNYDDVCNDVITSVDQIHINLDLVTEVEVEDSNLLYELTTNQTPEAPFIPDSNQIIEVPYHSVDSNQTAEAPVDLNQTPKDPNQTLVDSNHTSEMDPIQATMVSTADSISSNGILPGTNIVTTATTSPSIISIASSFHRAGMRALTPRIHLVRTTPIRSVTSSPCSTNGSLSKTPKRLKRSSTRDSSLSSKLSSTSGSKSTDKTNIENDQLGCSPVLTRTRSRDQKLADNSVSGSVSGTEHHSIAKTTRSRSGKASNKRQESSSATNICNDDISSTAVDIAALSLPVAPNDDKGMAQPIMEPSTQLRPRRGIVSRALSTNLPLTQANKTTSTELSARTNSKKVSKARHKTRFSNYKGNLHITDEYQQVITTTTQPNVTAMSVLGDIWSCSRITRSVKRKANELEDQLPKQLANPRSLKRKEALKNLAIESSRSKKLRLASGSATEQVDDMFGLNASVDELLRYSLVAYHLRRPSSSTSYNIAELSRRTLLLSPYGERKVAKNDVPSNSTGPIESERNKGSNASNSQPSNASGSGGGATPGRRSSTRSASRSKGKGIVSKPQKRRAGRRSNDSTSSPQNWTCCLCGQGSNMYDLGELYGPYNESGASIELSDKADGESVAVGEQAELWIHAVCAIWAPGVCLVGAEVKGLKEAIEEGSKMTCVVCKKTGAVMKCLNHSCKHPFHYHCAKQNDCSFNLDLFSITCSKHDSSKQSAL